MLGGVEALGAVLGAGAGLGPGEPGAASASSCPSPRLLDAAPPAVAQDAAPRRSAGRATAAVAEGVSLGRDPQTDKRGATHPGGWGAAEGPAGGRGPQFGARRNPSGAGGRSVFHVKRSAPRRCFAPCSGRSVSHEDHGTDHSSSGLGVEPDERARGSRAAAGEPAGGARWQGEPSGCG